MRRFALIAVLLLTATAAFGQNYTTVTAQKIQYVNGTLLPKGQLCFQATDQNDVPISFQVGGGGQVVNSPQCVQVVNGCIAQLNCGYTVANPALTTPVNILYRLTINVGSQVIYYCKGASFSGATFNFDTFVCPTVILPPSGGSVNGPLTINGALIITGGCTGCGGGSGGGFVRYYPTSAPNGSTTVFTFTGQAGGNTTFQLFWNGLLMNEVDDYSISISLGTTTVTCIRPPSTGDKLIAYF
jgi:hypothetical protein